MSLSIDKLQNIESVINMSRCKNVTSRNKFQNIESVANISRCKNITSIDKIKNTESVAFMLLLQNYHTDCYIITYPLRWKMTPLQWKLRVDPTDGK